MVHGRKLGRELGYATANVQLKHNRPPLSGIYAVRVHGVGTSSRAGVASLGVRPTITASGRRCSKCTCSISRRLYGAHMRVEFLHKIRDEAKYPDLDALKAQIGRDCDAARTFLLESRNV